MDFASQGSRDLDLQPEQYRAQTCLFCSCDLDPMIFLDEFEVSVRKLYLHTEIELFIVRRTDRQ